MNRDRVRVIGFGRRMIVASALTLAGMTGACSSGTQPDIKPTSVHIRVEGTAAEPLRLIVVTDFYEQQDDVTFEVFQVFEVADTFSITPPYDEVLPLSATGSVVVDLANESITPAEVRMRVDLDSGQSPYDQSAVMSDGASLRYVFAFLQYIL